MAFFGVGVGERGRRALKFCLFIALAIVLGISVTACSSDDEVEDVVLADIDRSPETAMVIPVGEPIVVGVSTALTGPIGVRGSEYRDAVVASVERWKDVNSVRIKGHEIEVQAEDDGCSQADVTIVRRVGCLVVRGSLESSVPSAAEAR